MIFVDLPFATFASVSSERTVRDFWSSGTEPSDRILRR